MIYNIKRSKHKSNSNINPGSRERLENLSHEICFSFKYVNFTEKFGLSGLDFNYYFRLIEVLINLGKTRADEFQEKTISTLSNHEIRWEDDKCTEDSFGLPDEENIAYNPWQFGLDRNKFGRVHGFFIDNRFYIRWFDPDHNLYKIDNATHITDGGYLDIVEQQFYENDQVWANQVLTGIKKGLEDEIKFYDFLIDEIIDKVCDECEGKIDELV